MSDGRVLCFGGPLNEQVVRVDLAWGNYFEAPVPERRLYSLAEMAEPMMPIRRVRYDIERVGVTIDDEPMVWEVAFVEGFPRRRVIDAANVVLTLCRVSAVAWLQVKGTD